MIRNLKNKKERQLKVCLKEDVEMEVANGFEKYSFVHKALPEIDFSEIDTSTRFLGKKLSAPILISSMVGGTASAGRINQNLAKAAQKVSVAMGVGSQRVALENQKSKIKMQNDKSKFKKKEIVKSFQVRDVAPDILLFANFGAVSLNYGFGAREAKEAVSMIEADGLILHLNPLQEAVQEGGETNFKGIIDKINSLCSFFRSREIAHVVQSVNFPIIVKEVGGGISYEVARKLYDAGVRIVDTAGAGGTSWAYIENQKSKCKNQNDKLNIKNLGNTFRNWGIPTAESLVQCKKVKGLKVIASGGIRNGIEIAKALCLGAELVGIGLPLLKAAQRGEERVEKVLRQLIFELKVAMFCVGARNVGELKKAKILRLEN